jgi:hypothetical protein
VVVFGLDWPFQVKRGPSALSALGAFLFVGGAWSTA